MAKTLLINPAKKRKTRTPAQRAATKRLVASNKKPTKRRTVTRKAKRRIVRRKRNPVGGNIMRQVMPAVTAASGALALDVMWGMLPVPINIKTGPFRHIAKAAGALAMGMVAKNFMGNAQAIQITTGALTVITHTAMREMVATNMPNIPLGYYSPGLPAGNGQQGVGMYVNGLGEYTADSAASPYLADPLSNAFSGPSAAMNERASMAECEAGY